MTKDELRAKYARIPTDFSEIEMLKDQLLESGLLDVAQVNPENAGKALIFGDDGTLTVGEAGSNLPIYVVDKPFSYSVGTVQDIIDSLPSFDTDNRFVADIYFTNASNSGVITNGFAKFAYDPTPVGYYIYQTEYGSTDVYKCFRYESASANVHSGRASTSRLYRLPLASAEDAGKVPVVNDSGTYELGNVSSGTQLYRHSIRLSTGSSYVIITNTSEQFTLTYYDSGDSRNNIVVTNGHFESIISFMALGQQIAIFASGYDSNSFIIEVFDASNSSWVKALNNVTSITDTVTAI